VNLAHELELLGRIDGAAAEFCGYLFENPGAGVPRGLYANLIVKCEPITYQGETWEPAVLFDFLPLCNASKAHLASETEPQVECSFYMAWHDPAVAWRLDFDFGPDTWPTGVRYQLAVNYSGYDGDACPDLKVSGASPVRFTGVVVLRDNIFPKPASFDDARTLLAPHLPDIASWREIYEEDEYGFPVSQPRSFRFTTPG